MVQRLYFKDLGVKFPSILISPSRILSIEMLEFKFILKPKYSCGPFVVEEGTSRILKGGNLCDEARLAHFKICSSCSGDDSEDLLKCKVIIKADLVSPFDLAASWRAYKENFQPSTVRGIPDITIHAAPAVGFEVWLISLIVYLHVLDFMSFLMVHLRLLTFMLT